MRKRLRQARDQRKWSQRKTAEKLGMTERAYRHLEAGTRNPSYSTAKKLEKLFGVKDEKLLVQDSEPNYRIAH